MKSNIIPFKVELFQENNTCLFTEINFVNSEYLLAEETDMFSSLQSNNEAASNVPIHQSINNIPVTFRFSSLVQIKFSGR